MKMYPIYHKHECNEIGLLTTMIDPKIGQPLLSKDFFHTNGKPCITYEQTICDHCGEPMRIMIESIDYENPVEVERHGS